MYYFIIHIYYFCMLVSACTIQIFHLHFSLYLSLLHKRLPFAVTSKYSFHLEINRKSLNNFYSCLLLAQSKVNPISIISFCFADFSLSISTRFAHTLLFSFANLFHSYDSISLRAFFINQPSAF